MAECLSPRVCPGGQGWPLNSCGAVRDWRLTSEGARGAPDRVALCLAVPPVPAEPVLCQGGLRKLGGWQSLAALPVRAPCPGGRKELSAMVAVMLAELGTISPQSVAYSHCCKRVAIAYQGLASHM